MKHFRGVKAMSFVDNEEMIGILASAVRYFAPSQAESLREKGVFSDGLIFIINFQKKVTHRIPGKTFFAGTKL